MFKREGRKASWRREQPERGCGRQESLLPAGRTSPPSPGPSATWSVPALVPMEEAGEGLGICLLLDSERKAALVCRKEGQQAQLAGCPPGLGRPQGRAMGTVCQVTLASTFLRGAGSFSYSREPLEEARASCLVGCCWRPAARESHESCRSWLPGWECSLLECPCSGELTPTQAAQDDSTASEALGADPEGVSDPLSTPGPLHEGDNWCPQKQLAQGRTEQGPTGSPSRSLSSPGVLVKKSRPLPLSAPFTEASVRGPRDQL